MHNLLCFLAYISTNRGIGAVYIISQCIVAYLSTSAMARCVSAPVALRKGAPIYITFAALRNVSSRTLVLVLWHAASNEGMKERSNRVRC